MSRFKQLFFRKSIWKGLFTIAVFMLVFFVSAPAYSVAAKRVDKTTQDEIAGSADADDVPLIWIFRPIWEAPVWNQPCRY